MPAISGAAVTAARVATLELFTEKGRQRLSTLLLILLLPLLISATLLGAFIEFITSPELWLGGDYSDLQSLLQDEYISGGGSYEDIVVGNFTGKLILPCDTKQITSDYGLRLHPIDKVIRKHTGIDFATKHHSNIYSIADGGVVATGVDEIFGRNITIKHEIEGETIYSFYAHLSKIDVAVGDLVSQGDTIALEGGEPGADNPTGKSTGHHLHFEIRKKPGFLTDVDPKQYLGGIA